MSIDPRMLSVTDWTDSMTFALSGLARPPRLDNPEYWKEWALTVIQAPRVSRYNPPDPRYFEDWREWAFRFNEALTI